MEEYIRELQEKVGLTEEQATKAVAVLFEKVKSKIPEPLQQMAANMFGAGEGSQEEGGSIIDKMQQFAKNTQNDSQ